MSTYSVPTIQPAILLSGVTLHETAIQKANNNRREPKKKKSDIGIHTQVTSLRHSDRNLLREVPFDLLLQASEEIKYNG